MIEFRWKSVYIDSYKVDRCVLAMDWIPCLCSGNRPWHSWMQVLLVMLLIIYVSPCFWQPIIVFGPILFPATLTHIQVPPRLKWVVYFGYCFPGPLLQRSLGTDHLFSPVFVQNSKFGQIRLSIEASLAHHTKYGHILSGYLWQSHLQLRVKWKGGRWVVNMELTHQPSGFNFASFGRPAEKAAKAGSRELTRFTTSTLPLNL